ncbi:hypothetical protein GCM10017567_67410 [Amycolatopsis bullii]|uniref:Uncharacterized protein n=1 Tax=Amycolatopsis bullii TaxID=941987 RepID=A0ABQ3KMJ7_9PSEU|nr:hypothetical protein GCM10017567_67410 [Amycolatopsis bullii]
MVLPHATAPKTTRATAGTADSLRMLGAPSLPLLSGRNHPVARLHAEALARSGGATPVRGPVAVFVGTVDRGGTGGAAGDRLARVGARIGRAPGRRNP